MSGTGHIVCLYNKTTKRTKKNAKPTKTSTNKTRKRPPRPNNPTIPKKSVNARIPSNNQDQEEFWCVFWS